MLELLKKYRTPLLAGGLILVALLLFSAQLRERGATNTFERAVLRITAPLQAMVDFLCDGVAGIGGSARGFFSDGGEITRLQEENRRLRAEVQQLTEVRLENERLSRLLEFRDAASMRAVPARVIAEDASSWFRTVLIDRGSRDGIAEGMPVVVAEGVVGRVIKTAPRESRVLLVTDASSAIAALVQESRARGVCRGQGEKLTFDFAMHWEEIAEGDLIVTSGTGGVFPKGLVIGSVSRVSRGGLGLFQGVEVVPAVDFYRLEEVLVLLRERQ